MSKSLTLEALVLTTHNVGEADRFCIFFTREKGRIAARARGVRKPGSRMGGHLLPLRHLTLELREGSAGYMIVGAERRSGEHLTGVMPILRAEQGMELLLTTIHDAEPMPGLFDVTLQFLHACGTADESPVLPFTMNLLKHSGMLPDPSNAFFGRCTAKQKEYLRRCTQEDWSLLPSLTGRERAVFSSLCATLLTEINTGTLKAGGVLRQMA